MNKAVKILICMVFVVLLVYLITSSVASHAGQCAEIKDNLQREIDSAAKCSTNQDCVVNTFDCAFGCNTVVNKNEVNRLTMQAREYAKQCHHFCPECKKSVGQVSCVDNLCKLSVVN